MKRTICKKDYDTSNATLIRKNTYGHYGDPCGYEETLYLTPDGLYFLYVNGGAESSHPEENILRIAKAKVDQWLEKH